jgi:hypothetical protein
MMLSPWTTWTKENTRNNPRTLLPFFEKKLEVPLGALRQLELEPVQRHVIVGTYNLESPNNLIPTIAITPNKEQLDDDDMGLDDQGREGEHEQWKGASYHQEKTGTGSDCRKHRRRPRQLGIAVFQPSEYRRQRGANRCQRCGKGACERHRVVDQEPTSRPLVCGVDMFQCKGNGLQEDEALERDAQVFGVAALGIVEGTSEFDVDKR